MTPPKVVWVIFVRNFVALLQKLILHGRFRLERTTVEYLGRFCVRLFILERTNGQLLSRFSELDHEMLHTNAL